MQIEDKHIFLFKFPFVAGDISFSIVADTKEDAVDMLQKWLQRTMTEISLAFPKVEAVPQNQSSIVPQEVIELKIISLAAELAKYGIKQGKTTKETVEKLTKIDYTPENYPSIITELEKIKQDAQDIKKI